MQKMNGMSDEVGNELQVVPSTPELNRRMEGERLAVETAGQAEQVCLGLIEENKDRIVAAQEVQKELDAIEPIYNPQELAEAGKGWMSNVSTGALSAVAERVIPRLVLRVKTSKYLTASTLSAATPDYATKTEAYRNAVSQMIRSWPKFNIFLPRLAKEMVDHGYSYAYWTDPVEWRPKIARVDRAFVPNGTEQGEPPQFFMVKEYYRVNELWDMIKDRQAAEESGYDIDNVVEAINNAAPINLPSEGDESEARQYEDLKREMVASYGYAQGSNTVEVWHLFVTEYNGKVSQWMLHGDTKQELFFAEERYESMDDVVVITPFQIGNGTVHGSLGVGKLAYDLAREIEKNRNASMDGFRNRMRMVIEYADPSDKPEVPLEIVDEAIFVMGGKTSGNAGMFPDNVEGGIVQDEFLRKLLEQKIGVYLFEPLTPQAPKTATEAQIIALEGEELKNSVLDNWLSSFARLVAAISRRALGGLSDDENAQELRESLLEIMDEDELQFLIDHTPTQTIVDVTDADNQRITAWLESKVGNPSYNQHEIQRLQGSLLVGADIVSQVLLPINDPTEEAEQSRLQLMEITEMLNNVPMPVSPRDAHLIHIGVLIGEENPDTGENQGPIYQQINTGNIQGAYALINHIFQHVDYAENQLGENMNDLKNWISEAQNRAEQVQNEFAQADEDQALPGIDPTAALQQ